MSVRMILGLAVIGTFNVAAMIACGGDQATPTDASMPKDTSVADTSVPDSSDATPPCAVDADLTQALKFDAAGIDSGGLNLQVCFDCLTTKCKSNIDACNADCDCKTGVVTFAGCVQGGAKIQTCGAQLVLGLSGASQGIATGLLGCAQGSCASECIPSDGGSKDASKDTGGGG